MSKYYQLEMISKAIKPQLVEGVWRKPKLSARRIARIRKECLRYGTINGVPAQWNPEWDKPKKSWIPRPPKGHADERALADRVALIDKNLKAMPKMIEETRKEAFLSKPHTFLDIKLDPEDYEVFYKIGRTMTNQQRKQDREKAAKAAAEAEAKAQKKKGSEKGGKKTSEKDSKKEKANKASKKAMKETEQTSMSA
ncbi:hypothetical protein JH06_4038 [Blastocystis sp. subtype 4]|uniref:hypothetical protein n=1 Tax=Blastocystis sp. subtype 4 TaxID=944170 RepID=UPI0007112B34|nr:hypothetical protein JH06_4038 [Blastocystis sp. subtype 4]KNB43138.1 hypothetical protein JH06_4038 [Blastocystis sp. subtype 4]|eukprot:XP_014526581.1 hypothetical protein JH06_4038 [Blastocystis sp. subtype 4]